MGSAQIFFEKLSVNILKRDLSINTTYNAPLFSLENTFSEDPLSSVADPVLFLLLDPGSGIRDGKNPDPGSGTNIRDHISTSLATIIWVKMLKFFVADPDQGSGIRCSFFTLYPGSGTRKFVSRINIPVPQHCL
jgi:hypothetical protein